MYTHKCSSSGKPSRHKEFQDARPSVLDKVWINHDKKGRITSALKYVKKTEDGNYIVAIARSYNSMPFYCKSTGKKFAKERMKKFFKLKNFNDGKTYKALTKSYNGKFFGAWESLPVFIMGKETEMNQSELMFWHNEVLPNIERELRNS